MGTLEDATTPLPKAVTVEDVNERLAGLADQTQGHLNNLVARIEKLEAQAEPVPQHRYRRWPWGWLR